MGRDGAKYKRVGCWADCGDYDLVVEEPPPSDDGLCGTDSSPAGSSLPGFAQQWPGNSACRRSLMTECDFTAVRNQSTIASSNSEAWNILTTAKRLELDPVVHNSA